MRLNIYKPFQRWFRPGRLRLFYRLMSITPETRVLDLGGSSYFWDLAKSLGLPLPRITVLNIRPAESHARPYLRWVVGDARLAPFKDLAFDIVFSNSLIEHLGDAISQARFASEVRRLAPSYFVQTPDRRFPVEPHFLSPFVHWFPDPARRAAIRNFTVWGMLNRPSPERCEELVREIRLLSGSGMRRLFPDGQLIIERFIGLPKSVIAFRRSPLLAS